ncbi:unnamed protein product [Ilex paraguariensis]
MLAVFELIEGYCVLVVDRVNLVEHEKVCPDELKEAVSSLIYAATRCGDLPELQEIRTVFTSRFGKEFVTRAVELRNNCGVSHKMIQKLSTRTPSLENRLKVLKEIASENNIVLQIEEFSSETTEVLEKSDAEQKQDQPKPDPPAHSSSPKLEDNMPIWPEESVSVDGFSNSMDTRRKYRDVADAAQAAFESAAYAAAAARAAVELSRSESHDPDDPNSPNMQQRKVAGIAMKPKLQTGEEDESRIENLNIGLPSEKVHPIHNYLSESEDAETWIGTKSGKSIQAKNEAELNRSVSSSSSDSADNAFKGTKFPSYFEDQSKPFGTGIDFDGSDDEINTVEHEELSERSGAKDYYTSHNHFPLSSQAGLEEKSGPGNPKPHFAEGSRTRAHSAQRLNAENIPISVRTRRGLGR